MVNDIVNNPDWWPHRYDPVRDHIHFIKATRDDHRAAVFLTDDYLGGASQPSPISRQQTANAVKQAPLHFIFHSAYCCSTLLARACDIPGVSMGLKEPVMLNDIMGWKLRGAATDKMTPALQDILTILARPFADNETVIVKPSNLVNALAPQILQMRPDSKAIFLYAPLEDFIGSIARKGMWGRLWARDLMVKQLRTGMIDLGLEGDDYLGLTDLQVAAVGWLAQHALFSRICQELGPGRIGAINSARLMKSPEPALDSIFQHFGLDMDVNSLRSIIDGPVFNSHSKTNEAFDAKSRDSDRITGSEVHADEIGKVSLWAKAVAQNAGIPMKLPSVLDIPGS